MKKTIILAALLLSACATGYNNPQNAGPRAQDTGSPYMNCPTGSVLACQVEGGGLVGKTYTDCSCTR